MERESTHLNVVYFCIQHRYVKRAAIWASAVTVLHNSERNMVIIG